jgi:hypothetical protein
MTDDEVARIIYDGVIGQWLPGMVRDALAANFDPRPIAAALAARRPATEAEQAVERVRELADELDLRARTLGPQASDYDRGYTAGLTDGETYAADRIRAALDGAARDGSDG